MQQLLQAHQEDGHAENQAAAEQAAAAAAGQAAESVLAGVVSRCGSRLGEESPAAGAAVACGAGASCEQHCVSTDQQSASEQRPDEQGGGAAEEEEVTHVEVQVLLAGAANSKQQLQEHGLSAEQVPC
jgi:hypothetical protein